MSYTSGVDAAGKREPETRMKIETAQAIVAAAEEVGLEGVTLYEGYSGRGMYGKTTAAVCFDRLGDFLAAVARVAADLQFDSAADGRADDFCAELQRLGTDGMGRGTVIY